MYTPHIITLFNTEEVGDELMVYRTVLDGVFLDTETGSNSSPTGVTSANRARLFIPFGIKARSSRNGSEKVYLSPKSFHNIANKRNVWTIEDSGDASNVPCYICKGDVPATVSYRELKQKYDDVYAVTDVKARDFGTADMQHWEVSLR